jgi:hypothetical protein
MDVRIFLTTWSPLTESNRRPSPYHPKPASPPERRTGTEQPERQLTATLASSCAHRAAAFCPLNCPRDERLPADRRQLTDTLLDPPPANAGRVQPQGHTGSHHRAAPR